MSSTRISRRVNAPRPIVYRAILDAHAVATWMVTITLADAGGGTDVLAVHDGLSRGLSTADNEPGWRSSLAKLAALVESG